MSIKGWVREIGYLIEEYGVALPWLLAAGFILLASLLGFVQWMAASLDERCVEIPAIGAIVGAIAGTVWGISLYKEHGEGLGCLLPIALVCMFIGAVSGGAFATLFLEFTNVSCEGYHLYRHHQPFQWYDH